MFDVQNDKNVFYIYLTLFQNTAFEQTYLHPVCSKYAKLSSSQGEKVPQREVVVIVSVLYIIWSFSNGVLKVRGQQSGGEKIPDGDNT